MVVIDAVTRLIPGVLNKEESHENDSFNGFLLDYPQYTRPREFEGKKVPEVLLSGHHEKIMQWRKEKQIEKTKLVRPNLYEKYMNQHKAEK